jgi:hypothetical protein
MLARAFWENDALNLYPISGNAWLILSSTLVPFHSFHSTRIQHRNTFVEVVRLNIHSWEQIRSNPAFGMKNLAVLFYVRKILSLDLFPMNWQAINRGRRHRCTHTQRARSLIFSNFGFISDSKTRMCWWLQPARRAWDQAAGHRRHPRYAFFRILFELFCKFFKSQPSLRAHCNL